MRLRSLPDGGDTLAQGRSHGSTPGTDASLDPAVAQNNVRSSQLFEASVALPLSLAQQRTIEQLDFFKRYFLLCHAAYVLAVVGVATLIYAALEAEVGWIDAFFTAMSTICNCGLQTVDVGEWGEAATLLRHLFMLLGGVVCTSAAQPLLRLLMLHRVRSVFDDNPHDTPAQRRLRCSKQAIARRLHYSAVISIATTTLFFVTANGLIMLLMSLFNTSQLSGRDVFYITIASFHGCVFLSMEQFAGDAVVVGLVMVACALGFTAFPAVLRWCFYTEWGLYKCAGVCTFLCCAHSESAEAEAEAADRAALLGAATGETGEEHEGRRGEASQWASAAESAVDPWDQGFRDILESANPGTFHPFLFHTNETLYLGFAWLALTLVQALPLWFQQWDGVLKPFSPYYKVYLGFCQAGVVRFAAASFVPLLEYTNAHVMLTILAMFLPALPISTDRTYRKWKQVFRTSMVRLLTSRLFWLIAAMMTILFVEESWLAEAVTRTRFDIASRTVFEVISAYAGCGLSLSVPLSNVSFIGSTSAVSKLVLAAVLFAGRHRFVDLGIDLGFSELQKDLEVVPTAPVTTTS